MVAGASNPRLALGSCEIHVGRGLLSRAAPLIGRIAPAHRYALITDANVGPLYASAVSSGFTTDTIDVITVPAGELHKTRETWASVCDQMLALGHGRDSAVIALGGGVIGDLAGFVAATFMRGIPVVQMPTTLLAMADAAIGGKTGVDTPAGKNLVGSFHPPSAVLADPEAIATLSLSELCSGLAEIIKYGVVADSSYFDWSLGAIPEILFSESSPARSDKLETMIVRGMELKAGIVSRDERETGVRKVLNFGHTVGHAVEVVSGYKLLHGEAVAIGMAVESQLAERIGIAESGTSSRIRMALNAARLPSQMPPECLPAGVLAAMRGDKKAREGSIRFALPRRIGEMANDGTDWSVQVADALIEEVLT